MTVSRSNINSYSFWTLENCFLAIFTRHFDTKYTYNKSAQPTKRGILRAQIRGWWYISLLEFIVEGVDLLVESGCSDFTRFIEKVDCEKTTLATCVMPFFHV